VKGVWDRNPKNLRGYVTYFMQVKPRNGVIGCDDVVTGRLCPHHIPTVMMFQKHLGGFNVVKLIWHHFAWPFDVGVLDLMHTR
jgi:hypothetical protein